MRQSLPPKPAPCSTCIFCEPYPDLSKIDFYPCRTRSQIRQNFYKSWNAASYTRNVCLPVCQFAAWAWRGRSVKKPINRRGRIFSIFMPWHKNAFFSPSGPARFLAQQGTRQAHARHTPGTPQAHARRTQAHPRHTPGTRQASKDCQEI